MKRVLLKAVLFAGFGLAPLATLAGSAVDLELSATSETNAFLFGQQISFDVNVTNASGTTATGVVLSDLLPGSWQYVYAQASQGTINGTGNLVDADLGNLPPGASVNVRIFVVPQAPGLFTNTASVLANEPNLGTNGTAELAINVFLAAPPVITSQPKGQLLNLGGLLNLVVGVLPSPETRFQWRLNGANILGATNANYSVLNLLAKDAGSYTVVVHNRLGATESQAALISLTGLLQLGASDSFANRAPYLNLLDLISYSNVGASSEAGEPLHAGVPGGSSVWFTWTPLLSGVVSFSTAGSSFDTLLAVYTGNNLTNLTAVASDDDSDGFYRSKVVFNAVAGTQYSIVVDGAFGAQGNIILSSSFQLLAPPVPQIVSGPTNQVTGPGGSAVFSATVVGKNLVYQWLFNDAPLKGATGSTLQLTNVSPEQVGLYRIRVISGSQSVVSAPASLQISTIDGQTDDTGLARDKFQAEAIAASGGPASLKTGLRTSSNGGRVHRLSSGTSRGYTGTQIFSTYGGATQTGEPNNCSNPGGASSWTSLQVPASGALTLDTAGSSFKTILGVYTGNGTDFSTLTSIACDVGSNTNTDNGRVTFAAAANTVYYISVDGVNGSYGTVRLSWSLDVPPSIISQPSSQTIAAGANVTLNATAVGNPAPKCQWFHNGALLCGATNWNLNITNFQAETQGDYQVLASNSSGSAATVPSSLVLYSGLRFDSSTMTSTNGAMEFRLVGVANTKYVIQASSDLRTWTPVATNSSPSGLWIFADPQAVNLPLRFYRAVIQ